MNRDVLESQWTQIREILREKFSNLTEDDIRQINGHYDQLVSKLQQKYGYSREEAEDRIRSWNFDRFAASPRASAVKEDKYYQESKVGKEDNSSFLKWLLGLGIPILLLGLYFFSPVRTETNSSPVVNQDQVITETPADRAISTDLRNAFIAQNINGSELQNIQITTHSGVVTLSGTVPNNEIRNVIVSTAQGFPGVRQVVNNLQTR